MDDLVKRIKKNADGRFRRVILISMMKAQEEKKRSVPISKENLQEKVLLAYHSLGFPEARFYDVQEPWSLTYTASVLREKGIAAGRSKHSLDIGYLMDRSRDENFTVSSFGINVMNFGPSAFYKFSQTLEKMGLVASRADPRIYLILPEEPKEYNFEPRYALASDKKDKAA